MPQDDIAFFVLWTDVEIHQRRLPHWEQDSVAVFVSWRLADALPNELLATWRSSREAWMARHPQPWDDATRLAYREQFGDAIESWLDAGHGSCVLQHPDTRAAFVRVLENFQLTRYRLHAWVAMPNHVHVLFSPVPPESPQETIRAWKGVSARRINQRLGRTGALWQPESWDTLIRSRGHFETCRRYIEQNPVRARLPKDAYSLWLEPGGA